MLALFSVLLAIASGVSTTLMADKINSPYDFDIPSSKNTVNLKIIHAGSALSPHSPFIKNEPELPTTPFTTINIWSFFVEHPQLKRRVLFDLGVRKDFMNLAPAARQAFSMPDGTLPFIVDRDVPEQLVAGGISLKSIDTLIWSHSHFDHVGDVSKLPNSTHIFVGPGTLASALPGYPADKSSWNLESDFVGHNITEIAYDGVKIAGAKSHDFFGDGSMYLLDAPGHIQGNLMALVRVTINPTTFVLLAGDAEAHPGLLRPSPGVPLPHSITITLPKPLKAFGAPKYDNPFAYSQLQNASIHQDAVSAQTTLNKLQRFDARPDTWVLLAHDGSLKTTNGLDANRKDKDAIPLFPKTINDFAKKGWKESSQFAFLQTNNPSNIWMNATGAHQA